MNQPITFSEIKNLHEYEKARPAFRERVIEEKKHRRITVGPHMTFVFENRTTMLFQIQEMMRVERIVDEHALQHEIDTYNKLLPTDNELSATLLIDITRKEDIRPVLDSLIGLSRGSIFLVIGDSETPAQFDEEQLSEDRISAVQYIRWHLADKDIERMRLGEVPVKLVVRHKNYNHETILTNEQRDALVRDLRVMQGEN
jgi:hypothetical protein